MNKITRYIWQSILVAMLLVMLLFIGLEFIFSLVNELRYVGTGNYATTDAFIFILLSLPQHIAQLFPMAALVGTLLGLGILASRSELIVLRAAGMSIGDIITMVLKLALILAIFVWLLGEWVSPMAEKIAHDSKALNLSAGQAIRTNHGTWLRDGNDFIHIQTMLDGGHIKGITLYHFDNQLQLQKASFAHHGDYNHDHWVLHDIQETLFEENKILRQKVEKLNWVSSLSPQVLNLVGVKDLDDLSLTGLWGAIKYRQSNQLDAKPYQLAFWQKIIRPLATLVMMFVAIPFVFGPLRSATMGLRMLVGVLVGFVFYTFNQLFGPLTLVYHMPPILGACLPTLLFLMTGMFFLKKVQ
ncbi:MAG: LPS export ABC transporter permease LptG [Proteobacteria bacterium]|nr:LPS export ABC transporter permease LptG [Pseudomonadota bacterium]